jgi:hypothetical protein
MCVVSLLFKFFKYEMVIIVFFNHIMNCVLGRHPYDSIRIVIMFMNFIICLGSDRIIGLNGEVYNTGIQKNYIYTNTHVTDVNT